MSRVNRDGWSVCSSSGQRESRIITLLSNCTSSKHIVDMFAMTRFWLNSFVPSFVPSILQLHYKSCPCYKVVLFMLQPCPCYNHVTRHSLCYKVVLSMFNVTRLYCPCYNHVTRLYCPCYNHVTRLYCPCYKVVPFMYKVFYEHACRQPL